ncbi:hypothetical protein D9M71_717190 [compost metagenome]
MVDIDEGEDRVAGGDQFAHIGHALADLAGDRRAAVYLFPRRIHLGYGTLRLMDLTLRGTLVLITGTCQCRVILRPRGIGQFP